MYRIRNFLETMNNFFFPYSYLQRPEFTVSRNLMAWDRMLKNLS